ncbi:retrovirus-related pol polyprotein from transposon TNT 1-94 [Tanacetum coccineum]
MKNRCISIEIKVRQYKESFHNNQPRNNQNVPEFPALFEINDLKAHLEAKNNSISKLKDHIALKGKCVSEGDKSENISKVITLWMYKLDLEPLSPKLLKIREAHVDYLKHTQENANTLCEIVEQARALRPLDSDLDSGCKFVTRIQELLVFGNDHVATIRGYGDYQIENVTISRAYFVEGLGHNLFSVGQFCDSDLEVAFRKHTCYVRDLEGVDLLKGSRGSNLYTMSLEEMMQSSPIYLLSKASKTKSWLWHRRLSHLNFGAINDLARQGKRKKHTHKPKSDDSIQEKLYLLHIDLCGPMRIKSINGKKCILVIVDEYLRFTWVKFLRLKDETPEIVIKLLKKIQVHLNATVHNIRTDNGTEFVNPTLQAHYEDVKISYQTLVVHTPQQNGVVEIHNRTLVEVNRSLIRKRHNKTPYELLHDRKLDLTYFHVFGALCYPTNDSEDQDKLKPKANIGIFIGYAPAKKAYQIYNRRTCLIMENIHVEFHELTAMASEQYGSGPEL